MSAKQSVKCGDGGSEIDSIAVSVFVFILIDFDKYTIRNKYKKKSDCEMSWLV